MAVAEKYYPLAPEFLLNAIYDIQEMRKAKITKPPGEKPEVIQVEMVTDMYKIKKSYLFRLTRSEAGTTVDIESDDDTEINQQDVHFMLAIMDGMIEPLIPHWTNGASND